MGWISSLFDHGKKRRSGDPEPKHSKKVSLAGPSKEECRIARKAVAEGDGETDLFLAADSGDASAVQALLQAGVDKEARMKAGGGGVEVTALCWASIKGHASVAEALVRARADIEAIGGDGMRPLHWAAMYGHASIVEVLAKAGADIEAKDGDGWRPLHWAAMEDHASVAAALVQAGADTEATGKSGETPLDVAVQRGRSSVVKVLAKAGADIEAKDGDGRRPLHYAALFGHASVVEVLVEAGADTEAKDRFGETPLDTAERNGHAAAVETLRNRTLQLKPRNLLRWERSGFPRRWVEDHNRQWGHSDWLHLLASLRRSEFWPMEEAAIGATLEATREHLKNATTAPPPSAPKASQSTPASVDFPLPKDAEAFKDLKDLGWKPTFQRPTSEEEAVDLAVESMLARRRCLDEGTFETGEKNPQPPILCSDDECPCADRQSLVLGRTAYLYISQAVVDFRKDCRTLLERELKITEIYKSSGDPKLRLFVQGSINPVYLCERGARRRGLDLSVALADAQRVAETGFAPLRPTPRAKT
jgi:ankyrin repeat protein